MDGSWVRSCVALIPALMCLSCNLFGTLDAPSTSADKYAAAIARANAGDCKGAKELLDSIEFRNDEADTALGWANLCVAGATAANIASSIYKYTGSNNDLTVIGILARTMLPTDADKQSSVDAAINAFGQIGDPRRRSIEVAIGKFVKASAILAKQAENATATGTLDVSDIAPSACSGASTDCTAGFASCTAGMTDANVDAFFQAITDAATALAVAGAQDLKTLADTLKAGQGATQTAGRCFIFKKTIPTE